MLNFFKKPFRWAGVFSLFTAAFTLFVLLDTFVIPKTATTVQAAASSEAALQSAQAAEAVAAAQITSTSYQDSSISITIETLRAYNTTYYVADIQLTDPTLLKTALAGNAFGRNLKQTTTEMAEEHSAILAINGDYYGFRDNGFVLRNGVLYRSTARSADNDDALVIDAEGNFSIVNESTTDAEALAESGAWQIFSFGPALVESGEIAVEESSEVGQAMESNPRTAIGQVGEGHYIIVVSDGRTSESEGLSLYQLAEIMQQYGCTTAYNLDGGGSSTLVFNGQTINNPTGGRGSSERQVSDIVYIGYTQ